MNPFKRLFLGILVSLMITSCVLNSQFSLPNDEPINEQLLGKWYLKANPDDFITIEKKDTFNYNIILKESDSTRTYRAHTKTIKGITILCMIYPSDADDLFRFFSVKVINNKLTYADVNGDLRKQDFESTNEVNAVYVEEDFKSNDELLAYFEENIKRKEFFDDETVLKRKK